MNDHVVKPIDVKQLFEVLGKWVSASAKPPDATAVEPGEPTDGREDALDSLEGFDVEEGLSRLGGNRKLYVKLLRDLAREHAEDAEVIRETLAKGDTKGARALAHTLKGMAGNLAAQEVYEASAALETTLKHDNDKLRDEQSIDDRIAELDEALTRTVAALQVLDADTDQREEDAGQTMEGGTSALPPDRALEMGNRLRDAVEMGNISQVQMLVELLPQGSPHRRKLSALVDNFDFQGMIEVATELKEMRP
jgi:HPt (histidine-containing phosphotransfer) domain-containing protein